MIKFFTNDHEFTLNNFFDYVTHDQRNDQDFPCTKATKTEMNAVVIENTSKKLFEMIEKTFGKTWCGEPIDARSDFTKYILDKFPFITTELKTVSFLKNFYKV